MSGDRLGEHLIACRVVTRAQWDEATARAGSSDPRAALNILSRTRAHWAPDSDPGPVPALTAYQLKRIDKWLDAPNGPFPADRLVWNNYLLLAKLAAGGMGVVFKGWCPVHRRYVAIKRTLSDSGELRRRLRREAELLRQLHHPAVAEFYAREELDADDLLVMEFVPGKTLFDVIQERLAKHSPVPWQAVAEWAVELLGALHHLNGNNAARVVMVHRDVKPSNVMLRPDGQRYRAVLVDFGLARAAEGTLPAGTGEQASADLTQHHQFLGTPEYAAPEQWRGGRAALPESDVYSLGGTLFYALTGRAPFGMLPTDAGSPIAALMQMMTKHRYDPRPGVRAERDDVPPEMDQLLARMMAVDPLDRSSAYTLRARFEALLREPAAAQVRQPVVFSSAVKVPNPRPGAPAEPPPQAAPVTPATRILSEPLPAPAPTPPATVPESAPVPDANTYRLDTSEPLPPKTGTGSGSGTGRKKRSPVAQVPPIPPEPVAAAPPAPATGEVLGAFFEWFGARLGGPRRGAAPVLWRAFRRRGGMWVRAYARPHQHPGRWAFLLGTVALVGLVAGWDWAFIPVVVVALMVVFAFLGEE